MTAVDFCDHRLVVRFRRRASEQVRELSGVWKAWATIVFLGAISISLEAARLESALKGTAALERDRDALAHQVALANQAFHDASENRKELFQLLRARRAAVSEASAIIRIGNAISSELALTALRKVSDGFAIEGKSKSVAGVGTTLRRLADDSRLPNATLDLRRESGEWVAFEIVLSTDRTHSTR